jgi:hypothetical protein
VSERGRWERAPLAQRVFSRFEVDLETGCWIWTGNVNAQGYGLILPNGSEHRLRAHRAAYELTHGPIPEGMDIDHLCHNADADCPGGADCRHRRCINPQHLEPVARGENVRRAATTRSTCRNGHPRTPENTMVKADGRRECRPCYRQARKDRAAA